MHHLAASAAGVVGTEGPVAEAGVVVVVEEEARETIGNAATMTGIVVIEEIAAGSAMTLTALRRVVSVVGARDEEAAMVDGADAVGVEEEEEAVMAAIAHHRQIREAGEVVMVARRVRRRRCKAITDRLRL